MPTDSEAEIPNRGIELINSRPCHPQTDGKLERFHRSVKEGIWNRKSLYAYIKRHNETRLHFSLGIHDHQTI